MSGTLQPEGHLAAAEVRVRGVMLVDQLHQRQVLRCLSGWLIVQAGAAKPQQVALSPHAQLGVIGLHQRAFQLNGLGHFFLSHSNSILSRPICSNSSAWAARASVAAVALTPLSKTVSAPWGRFFFQAVKGGGWTGCWLASLLTVLSPFSAARATWALNAAVCFFLCF